MAIDFHAPKNRNTYAGRTAGPEWRHAMLQIVDPTGLRVTDIGCGGGIYTAAWADLGAREITGIDFSAQMVRDATDANRGRAGVRVRQADARHTGLPDETADIVFERALIHHLPGRTACFQEAWRVLAPDGLFIVQDRTPEDVELPASAEHLRGYFFELFPRLLAVEHERRADAATVWREMTEVGFEQVNKMNLWEVRKRHVDAAALAADLRGRTGRSILHELSDEELEAMIVDILARVPREGAIPEKDRWTIWWGRKGNL
jgi:ubiquinone/menaquinone biosynthesis C-methylase UbiE